MVEKTAHFMQERLELDFQALALTLVERYTVPLKAVLEGITLDEAETYGTLRNFASPAELVVIVSYIDSMFITGPIDRWDLVDKHAMPARLNRRPKETAERAEELRELASRWFGARAGNAARQNQHFLWPSWFCDDPDRSTLMFDWPVRLPCPCCGSDRDGVFTGPQPSWQFDDEHLCFAQFPECQNCGHVDRIGCACKVCGPDGVWLLRNFSEHVKGLHSFLLTMIDIVHRADAPCKAPEVFDLIEIMLDHHDFHLAEARRRTVASIDEWIP